MYFNFQSDKILSEKEVELVINETKLFISKWDSHRNKISANVDFYFNIILTISITNEVIASGCSIDKLITFIISLNNKFEIDFLNRNKVYFKANNKIDLVALYNIRSYLINNINASILTFSQSSTTNFDLKFIDIKQSWVKKYLLS